MQGYNQLAGMSDACVDGQGTYNLQWPCSPRKDVGEGQPCRKRSAQGGVFAIEKGIAQGVFAISTLRPYEGNNTILCFL